MNLRRVQWIEWVTGLAGIILLVAVFALPWFGDNNAPEAMPVIHVFLALAALMAIAMPFVVAGSARTNVPITYETFVSTIGSLALVLVLIRFVFPPDGGFRAGAWIGLASVLTLAIWAWKSVSRGG